MLYLAFLLLLLISRCKITVFTPFHKGFSPLFFQPVSPKRPNHLKHKQIRRLFSCRKNPRCVPCVETPPNSSAKKAKNPWWSQDFAVILCVPCVETPPNSSAKKAKNPWWSQDFAVILRLVRFICRVMPAVMLASSIVQKEGCAFLE